MKKVDFHQQFHGEVVKGHGIDFVVRKLPSAVFWGHIIHHLRNHDIWLFWGFEVGDSSYMLLHATILLRNDYDMDPYGVFSNKPIN